jgi:hypothetical protein
MSSSSLVRAVERLEQRVETYLSIVKWYAKRESTRDFDLAMPLAIRDLDHERAQIATAEIETIEALILQAAKRNTGHAPPSEIWKTHKQYICEVERKYDDYWAQEAEFFRALGLWIKSTLLYAEDLSESAKSADTIYNFTMRDSPGAAVQQGGAGNSQAVTNHTINVPSARSAASELEAAVTALPPSEPKDEALADIGSLKLQLARKEPRPELIKGLGGSLRTVVEKGLGGFASGAGKEAAESLWDALDL